MPVWDPCTICPEGLLATRSPWSHALWLGSFGSVYNPSGSSSLRLQDAQRSPLPLHGCDGRIWPPSTAHPAAKGPAQASGGRRGTPAVVTRRCCQPRGRRCPWGVPPAKPPVLGFCAGWGGALRSQMGVGGSPCPPARRSEPKNQRGAFGLNEFISVSPLWNTRCPRFLRRWLGGAPLPVVLASLD